MKSADEIAEIYQTLSDTYDLFEDSDDEWMKHGLSATPFRSIVSVALSTMTTSPRTIKAALNLFEKVSTFEDLTAIDDDELREAIRSVAHYNRKTVNLKQMSRQILTEHHGQVPSTEAELLALPGIGRKCTDILMNFTHGADNIAVDTHVHRVVNRLGVVDTDTAEHTADELSGITPQRYRKHAHEWLIQHGMNRCKARRPLSDGCVLRDHCEHVGS